MIRLYTLIFVLKGNRVLLGMKKRGFGAGRWNGFGGKVLEGEGLEQAAARELKEEINIIPGALTQCGLLDFIFDHDPATTLKVHIFTTRKYSGVPKESEEMRPQWFDRAKIPFAQMWPDDELWFPFMFAGKRFSGTFHFGAGDTILRYTLNEAKNL